MKPVRDREVVRVCRGFRALDALSDEECLRLYSWLADGSVNTVVGSWLVQLMVMSVMLIAWSAVVLFASPAWLGALDAWCWSAQQHGAVLAILFTPGAAIVFRVMSTLRRGDMAATVSRALARPVVGANHALTCGYALTGLRPVGTLVTCPECGRSIDLKPPNLFESVWVDGRLQLPARH